MKISDNEFLRHEGLLAIDPGFSFYSGLGWAYFESSRLKSCGLVKPFAPGGLSEQCIFEIMKKFTCEWEKIRGFHIKPKILCIESPVNFGSYGRKINAKSLDDIHFLNGMLTERFKPLALLRPTPITWKGNKPKEKHHVEIISSLDPSSKKLLESCLSEIKTAASHNIIDAVGLGLYALSYLQELKDKGKDFNSTNMRKTA